MNRNSIYKIPSKALLWIAGGADPSKIEELEKSLCCKLPEDYKCFLSEHGAVSVGDSAISGIASTELDDGGGSVYSDTIRFRKLYNLPSILIVIEANEEAPYCLNVSENSEFGSIVCFQIHTNTSKKISGSFKEWFDTYFLLATS